LGINTFNPLPHFNLINNQILFLIFTFKRFKVTQEYYSRYARQTILPQMGLEGQEKLTKAKVLVIGCGGLGGPVLSYRRLLPSQVRKAGFTSSAKANAFVGV
jgi:hypothetical protein